MIATHARKALSRFRRDEDGVAAVEFCLLLPMLVTLFLGLIGLLDAYRNSEGIQGHTNTIADMMSRETTVDDAYMQERVRLLTELLGKSGSPADVTLTVTSVKRNLIDDKGTPSQLDDDFELVSEWRFDSVGNTVVRNLGTYSGRQLPIQSNGESLLVIESSVRDQLMLGYFGVGKKTFSAFTVLAPRFTIGLFYS